MDVQSSMPVNQARVMRIERILHLFHKGRGEGFRHLQSIRITFFCILYVELTLFKIGNHAQQSQPQ